MARVDTPGRALKSVGLVIVALGSLFFLIMGVGEIAGGEVSGVQHLPAAALLAALVYLGRRHPYGVGVVLVLIGLGLASLYATGFFGSHEPVGMRIAWALQVALPPLAAGVLLLGAARREREGPKGRVHSANAH
jgi:protein-S-isoprenylcysteine O-methyltransferase Ste14